MNWYHTSCYAMSMLSMTVHQYVLIAVAQVAFCVLVLRVIFVSTVILLRRATTDGSQA